MRLLRVPLVDLSIFYTTKLSIFLMRSKVSTRDRSEIMVLAMVIWSLLAGMFTYMVLARLQELHLGTSQVSRMKSRVIIIIKGLS